MIEYTEGIDAKSGRGFEMCEMAKTRCIKEGSKVSDGRCADAWEKCGMEMKMATSGKVANADGEAPFMKGKPRFEMCEIAKKRCMNGGGSKVLDGLCAEVWKKCGMEMKMAPPGKVANADMEAPFMEGKPRFKVCEMAKKRCMNGGGSKVLDGLCAEAWKKCGIEVKMATPDKIANPIEEASPMKAKLQEWVGKLKEGFFRRLKVMKKSAYPDALQEAIFV